MPRHLLHLIDKVQQTVICAKSEGTVKTYLGGFNRWKRWSTDQGLCHFPANVFHVACYLQCLLGSAQSPAPINNAIYSIDWAHSLGGVPKISDHPVIAAIIAASKRLLGKPKNRKEPVTADMLNALVLKYGKDCSLGSRRIIAMCLIGYAGFLRFSELCFIKCCDISLFPSYVSIFIESSKTDQFREGGWVTIARTGLDTCPVSALEKYIAAANLNLGGGTAPISRFGGSSVVKESTCSRD